MKGEDIVKESVDEVERDHRQTNSQNAAHQSDQLAFHDVLHKHRPPTGSQRSTHAHFRSSRQKLAQQDADEIDRADDEEKNGDDQEGLGLVGDGLELFHRRRDIQ